MPSTPSPFEFYFDPLDGTFVRIGIDGNGDDMLSVAECSGTLSEQGKRDGYLLVITMTTMAFILLILLYITCYSRKTII